MVPQFRTHLVPVSGMNPPPLTRMEAPLLRRYDGAFVPINASPLGTMEPGSWAARIRIPLATGSAFLADPIWPADALKLPAMADPNERAALPCEGPAPDKICAVSAASWAVAGRHHPAANSAAEKRSAARYDMGMLSSADVGGYASCKALARPVNSMVAARNLIPPARSAPVEPERTDHWSMMR